MSTRQFLKLALSISILGVGLSSFAQTQFVPGADSQGNITPTCRQILLKSLQNSGFAYLPRIPAAFVDETANPAVANLDVNFIYFDGAFYEMSIPSSVCGTQPPSDARWTVLEIDGNAIGQLLSTIPFQR